MEQELLLHFLFVKEGENKEEGGREGQFRKGHKRKGERVRVAFPTFSSAQKSTIKVLKKEKKLILDLVLIFYVEVFYVSVAILKNETISVTYPLPIRWERPIFLSNL